MTDSARTSASVRRMDRMSQAKTVPALPLIGGAWILRVDHHSFANSLRVVWIIDDAPHYSSRHLAPAVTKMDGSCRPAPETR